MIWYTPNRAPRWAAFRLLMDEAPCKFAFSPDDFMGMQDCPPLGRYWSPPFNPGPMPDEPNEIVVVGATRRARA